MLVALMPSKGIGWLTRMVFVLVRGMSPNTAEPSGSSAAPMNSENRPAPLTQGMVPSIW